MPIKLTRNSFYEVIKYKILSHFFFGKRKKHYQMKYRRLKELLNGAATEYFYFLGLRIITVSHIKNLTCFKILGFPIIVQCGSESINEISASERSIFSLLTILEEIES